MQLVYIERTTADSDDTRLLLLLEARAKAALRCLEANRHAGDIRRDLITHLARRLADRTPGNALRKTMIDAGMDPSMVSEILRAAANPDYFTLHNDPRQRNLPYGA